LKLSIKVALTHTRYKQLGSQLQNLALLTHPEPLYSIKNSYHTFYPKTLIFRLRQPHLHPSLTSKIPSKNQPSTSSTIQNSLPFSTSLFSFKHSNQVSAQEPDL